MKTITSFILVKYQQASNKKMATQAGGSIIEILIATLIVATVITAIITGLSLSTKNTAEIRQRTLARQIAQEGLESFRSARQNWGWQDFFTELEGGDYCYAIESEAAEDSIPLTAECDGETPLAGIGLTRTVNITKNTGADASEEWLRVRVEVSWEDGDKTHQVEVAQTFRNF